MLLEFWIGLVLVWVLVLCFRSFAVAWICFAVSLPLCCLFDVLITLICFADRLSVGFTVRVVSCCTCLDFAGWVTCLYLLAFSL